MLRGSARRSAVSACGRSHTVRHLQVVAGDVHGEGERLGWSFGSFLDGSECEVFMTSIGGHCADDSMKITIIQASSNTMSCAKMNMPINKTESSYFVSVQHLPVNSLNSLSSLHLMNRRAAPGGLDGRHIQWAHRRRAGSCTKKQIPP
jgi:hypothetical protein